MKGLPTRRNVYRNRGEKDDDHTRDERVGWSVCPPLLQHGERDVGRGTRLINGSCILCQSYMMHIRRFRRSQFRCACVQVARMDFGVAMRILVEMMPHLQILTKPKHSVSASIICEHMVKLVELSSFPPFLYSVICLLEMPDNIELLCGASFQGAFFFFFF
ncbi:hypothetical protein POVWA2_004980 [Plasmodium ovale wallikeri]|uniref:Uncharacterized protein n=1 Tax=Plasmodium ovale wallikeri TaxID=864142 RepID=A0A1A8YJ79_PLAOA|nr:hypothetical protein POVWA1_004920 [Plasmodium ovale wallikeri]SBT31593.1 hypothetical protein POVWA2_004980 [Plasmodium ovale wallikeri]